MLVGFNDRGQLGSYNALSDQEDGRTKRTEGDEAGFWGLGPIETLKCRGSRMV